MWLVLLVLAALAAGVPAPAVEAADGRAWMEQHMFDRVARAQAAAAVSRRHRERHSRSLDALLPGLQRPQPTAAAASQGRRLSASGASSIGSGSSGAAYVDLSAAPQTTGGQQGALSSVASAGESSRFPGYEFPAPEVQAASPCPAEASVRRFGAAGDGTTDNAGDVFGFRPKHAEQLEAPTDTSSLP